MSIPWISSVNNTAGEVHYTHPRIRSAYRNLITNLPYLLTYKNYKNLHISNTTNAFKGGVFSYMKDMKLILVDYYLLNYKKKY